MTEDIEGIAGELLRCAGADESAPAKPVALVQALLGAGSLFSVHARSLPGDGSLAIVNGQPRIYIRTGLTHERKRWAICHELAEWWLWREGVRDSRIENVADGIAAGLLAPRRAFLAALRDGSGSPELAQRFGTTESCAVLRLGEVTGHPLALVAPNRVRVRGDEFVWGDEDQVRRLAKCSSPGFARSRLTDDRRRIALRAC